MGLNPPSRSGSFLLDDLRFEVDEGVESERLLVPDISSSPLRFERLDWDMIEIWWMIALSWRAE
jgi:hypothetical protein